MELDGYHTIKNNGSADIEVTTRGGEKVRLKRTQKVTCIPTRIKIVGDGTASFTCNIGQE